MGFRFIRGSKQGWDSLPVRFIEIPLVDFFSNPHDQSENMCNTVTTFARACQLTLNIVRAQRPGAYGYALYVARQYVVVVCKRFLCQVDSVDIPYKAEKIRELELEIEAVDEILRDHWPAETLHIDAAPDLVRIWMSMTIFHIVFAAIAPDFDPEGEDDLVECIRHCEHGEEWIALTKDLRPNAALLDYSECIVSTTVARWRVSPTLSNWEKLIRDTSILDGVKDVFRCARRALDPLRGRPCKQDGEEWEDMLAKGRRLIQQALGECDVISRLCAGHKWVAVRRLLTYMDQCATCQICFWAVRLPKANEAPSGSVDEIWDTERGWQCCEAERYNTLWCQRLADMEGRLLAALVRPFLRCSDSAPTWHLTSFETCFFLPHLRLVPPPPVHLIHAYPVVLTPCPPLLDLLTLSPALPAAPQLPGPQSGS